ncbi:unnamed protein product [Lupinus luteus]|uniref:RRM domain-containing protein n=1 Tax=Lupinus luteus TaxID=3873 RepID=A0AAV1WUQ1_LUPLU
MRERGRERVREWVRRESLHGRELGRGVGWRRFSGASWRPSSGRVKPHDVFAHVSRRRFSSRTSARGRSQGVRRRDFAGELSSFYITNFPESASSNDLWAFSQKWGRVDVYIPLKRNRNDQRFAFIRFDKVLDERSFAKEFDKLWFGNYKLFANIPMFRKDVEGIPKPKVSTPLVRVPPAAVPLKLRDSRSYVEAVNGVGSQGEVDKLPSVGVPSSLDRVLPVPPLHVSGVTSELEWLTGCVVGRVHKEVSPDNVAGLLQADGIFTISVHLMGGDLLLLSPLAGENVLDVFKDAGGFVSFVFSSVIPWSVDCVPECRDVWVRFFGILVHSWNVDMFDKIAREFGSLLVIDNDALNKVRFDMCIMKIRVLLGKRLDSSFGVVVDEKEFVVHMREELCGELPRPGSVGDDESKSYVSDSHFSSVGLGDGGKGWISDSFESDSRSEEEEVTGRDEAVEREGCGGNYEGCVPNPEVLNSVGLDFNEFNDEQVDGLEFLNEVRKKELAFIDCENSEERELPHIDSLEGNDEVLMQDFTPTCASLSGDHLLGQDYSKPLEVCCDSIEVTAGELISPIDPLTVLKVSEDKELCATSVEG